MPEGQTNVALRSTTYHMREDRQAVQTECLASVGWRIVAYGAADDRVTVRFQYGDKLISKDAEFVSVGAALTGPQRGVLYFFSLGYLKSKVYKESLQYISQL